MTMPGSVRSVRALAGASCNCPVLPAFDELTSDQLKKITGKPLCCTSCGEELELSCPQGHVHRVPKTPSPNKRPAARPIADIVALRECPCGTQFRPRSFQRRCNRCLAATAPGTNSARHYQPKRCEECGETFTPTGPRSLTCAECRGAAQPRETTE